MLFSADAIKKINQVAEASNSILSATNVKPTLRYSKLTEQLQSISKEVQEYFSDSKAELITTDQDLHKYIDDIIKYGYAGIDTETTGLDRIKDHVVGMSLYVPGRNEVYIPFKHIQPVFDMPYKNQISYDVASIELKRLVDANVKLIFANADFDIAMIDKDFKVNLSSICYYDVILAWRCIKDDEPSNSLKPLYVKYVLKGLPSSAKKFNDFFTPDIYPYSDPQVAKLYAANDAKITFELFKWQLQYLNPNNDKCIKRHLERVANIFWKVEMPLVPICNSMHKTGMYVDFNIADKLRHRYANSMQAASTKLSQLVDEAIDDARLRGFKFINAPFTSGTNFNAKSTPHVQYLVYDILGAPLDEGGSKSTDKDVLSDMSYPVVKQLLEVRSLGTVISTFIEKLPNAVAKDGRIHARFNQIGARTGRFSSADPKIMQIGVIKFG